MATSKSGATFSLLGVGEPLAIWAASFSSTAAGGLFVMKVKVLYSSGVYENMDVFIKRYMDASLFIRASVPRTIQYLHLQHGFQNTISERPFYIIQSLGVLA